MFADSKRNVSIGVYVCNIKSFVLRGLFKSLHCKIVKYQILLFRSMMTICLYVQNISTILFTFVDFLSLQNVWIGQGLPQGTQCRGLETMDSQALSKQVRSECCWVFLGSTPGTPLPESPIYPSPVSRRDGDA